MNPLAVRLLSQQLVSPQFAKPEKVVGHMGAMQAQDYRMVRWAVGMRTKRPSIAAFREAFDEGRIIRLHLHRGTWQLVSAEDYWWMLSLCQPRAEATVKGWMKSNKVEIGDKELYQVRDLLIRTADTRGSATKQDFGNVLREHGITMDDHRLSYHIRLAEVSGILCSGNLTPRTVTYALAEKKVKRTSVMERDEMLMLLAKKYFQGHAPATFEDYAWWSGLGTADCRLGMQLLGNELHRETWMGYAFYLLDSSRTRGFRRGNALLLAPYDEYLIGYKTRELALAPHHVPYAHTNNGIFFPVIAEDGIICGNWSPWKKTLKAGYFDSEEKGLDLEKQWERFSAMKKIVL